MHQAKKLPFVLFLLVSSAAMAQSLVEPSTVGRTKNPSIPVANNDHSLNPQPAGALTDVTVTYTYDSLGRLTKDAYPANTATYTYDAAGNRTQTGIQ